MVYICGNTYWKVLADVGSRKRQLEGLSDVGNVENIVMLDGQTTNETHDTMRIKERTLEGLSDEVNI